MKISFSTGLIVVVVVILVFVIGWTWFNGYEGVGDPPSSSQEDQEPLGEPAFQEDTGQEIDVQQVVEFYEAIWLLKPEDTEEARRQRVSPYVVESVIPQLELGICVECESNRIRVEDSVVRRAEIDESNVVIEEDEGVLYVSVTEVLIVLESPDGLIAKYGSSTVNTVWAKDGTWKVHDTY